MTIIRSNHAISLAAIFATGLSAGAAFAADPQGEKKDPMMEAWMKSATPGEPHKVLEGLAGSWTTKTTWWMAPGAPPEESAGTSDVKVILGGRYIEDTAAGTAMGMPFEGRGITGYDNIKKKYISMWIDNMSTSLMTAEGTLDAKTNTINSKGEYLDPMGKKHKVRMTHKLEADTHVFTMFDTPPGKKEFKTMEMVYTRKK